MEKKRKLYLACCRCRKALVGEAGSEVTAGYYDMSGSWGEFAKNGERILCDECMWSDPDYIRKYGRREMGN